MNASPRTTRFPAVRLVRRLAVGVGLMTLLTVVFGLSSWFIETPNRSATSTANQSTPLAAKVATGWGYEALRTPAPSWSPIPVANACGLGASSCFKCHNGQRAPAPKMDKTGGLWHSQHMHVNDDCVGCHAGNPRIIKKELAHEGLVKDPRTKPERCDSCHKGQDTVALMKQYQMAK
jgi:hypothetical protein